MKTITDILSEYTYLELLDLRAELIANNPGHEILPWVQQEIEICELVQEIRNNEQADNPVDNRSQQPRNLC